MKVIYNASLHSLTFDVIVLVRPSEIWKEHLEKAVFHFVSTTLGVFRLKSIFLSLSKFNMFLKSLSRLFTLLSSRSS